MLSATFLLRLNTPPNFRKNCLLYLLVIKTFYELFNEFGPPKNELFSLSRYEVKRESRNAKGWGKATIGWSRKDLSPSASCFYFKRFFVNYSASFVMKPRSPSSPRRLWPESDSSKWASSVHLDGCYTERNFKLGERSPSRIPQKGHDFRLRNLLSGKVYQLECGIWYSCLGS